VFGVAFLVAIQSSLNFINRTISFNGFSFVPLVIKPHHKSEIQPKVDVENNYFTNTWYKTL